MTAPPLLVYGRPVTLLLHATRNPVHTRVKRLLRSRAVTAMAWPPVTVVLYAAVVIVTHLTPLMNQVLADQAVHDAEHAAYLVAGYLFFLPVIGSEPLRWRLPRRAATAPGRACGAACRAGRPCPGPPRPRRRPRPRCCCPV